MKNTFAQTVTEIAFSDPKVLLITGDFCFQVFDRLKAERPKQYLNLGAGEQSMVSVAAGLAIAGFIPFVYAITPFLMDRAFEQIKLDIVGQKLHVILVGCDHYPSSGLTHKAAGPEEMCKLIGLRHFSAWSPISLGWVTRKSYQETGAPIFIRIRP